MSATFVTMHSVGDLIARFDQGLEDAQLCEAPRERAIRLRQLGTAYAGMVDAAVEYRLERDIYRLVADGSARTPEYVEPEAFVRCAADVLRRLPRVEHGYVLLFDDLDGRPDLLEPVSMETYRADEWRQQISTTVLQRVRDTQENVYLAKARRQRTWKDCASIARLELMTVFCCPIPGPAGGPPRGAIYLENRSCEDAFIEHLRDAVEMLAGQIGSRLDLLVRARETDRSTAELLRDSRFTGVIGSSPETVRLLHTMDRFLQRETVRPLLITGETGVGKDHVARILHEQSSRRDGPYVVQNLSALSETVLESMLFGTVEGAFTGVTTRKGLIQQADGGTLVLNEIGDLTLTNQVRLLDVLDRPYVRGLGAKREKKVDVQILALTNVDLRKALDKGRFRQDLYYRLHGGAIHIEPLRARRGDIEDLVCHFVAEHNGRTSGPKTVCSPDFLLGLRAMEWLGNVRELKIFVEETLLDSQGPALTRSLLDTDPAAPRGNETDAPLLDLKRAVAQYKRRVVEAALEAVGPQPKDVAAALGISRSHLYGLLERYGIPRQRKPCASDPRPTRSRRVGHSKPT